MRHTTILIALLIAFALGPAASATHTESGHYVLPVPFVAGTMCSPCTSDDVNLGGVSFAPTGEIPVRVDVADVTGGDVSFSVWQCSTRLCRDWVDPFVTVCGTTVDLTKSGIEFNGRDSLNVFIETARPDCLGTGTTGVVTVTYG